MGILSLVVTSAVVLKTEAIKRKKEIGIGKSLSLGLRKMPRLLVANIIAAIIIGLGLLCLIIPGIYLAVRLSFVTPACVLENNFGISRSWALTKSRFWELFALIVVLMIIGAIASAIPYAGMLISLFFVSPLATISYTLAYLKLS